MSTNYETPAPDAGLREVQVAFLQALEAGDRPDSWLRQYPQHAPVLIDLAGAFVAEQAIAAPTAAEVAQVAASARKALAAVIRAPAPTLSEQARHAGLSLRELAGRVGLTSEILFKMDRRVIRPETVPTRLLRDLADALGCTLQTVRAGLAGSAPLTAGAFYHAKQAPEIGRQTFAEAVATSVNLAPDARDHWLAAAAEEQG